MNEAIGNLIELGKRLKVSDELPDIFDLAESRNPWFTKKFLNYALDAVVNDMLSEAQFLKWLPGELPVVNKTVGLIFAGNLPLVGLHDFLCCYVLGCKMKIKLSSKDDELFPFILKKLQEIDKGLAERVEVVDRLKDFDAVIATGSDNTNRYFEYYFRNYPKILRKNRNSIAILTGEETAEDLEKLADDIFLYFGFGCRNVSKLYVPQGYDIKILFPHFAKYSWLHQHGKFMNNYDYNRTILLLNKTAHLANEFIMIVESPSIPSPISVLHYEVWNDENLLKLNLKENGDKIQCVVSAEPKRWNFPSSVSFGQSQHPALWDYADNVNTIDFLTQLK
ncbi:MAG: hypothetical protein JWO06_1990 [Bacteroidota bacterium]|nr:hypothetical protein [Bacteroidota bacterium]